MEFSGIGGLVLLVLDVWAIVSIVNAPVATGRKVIWILVVLILPLLGFLIWLVAGPRSASAR